MQTSAIDYKTMTNELALFDQAVSAAKNWMPQGERLKHCNLSTIPKKGAQNQAPKKRAKKEVVQKN